MNSQPSNHPTGQVCWSPEARHPKTETQNPKPETRSPKPETRNPKPNTLHPTGQGCWSPETRNPKPKTRNSKPETRKPKPETRNPTRWTRLDRVAGRGGRAPRAACWYARLGLVRRRVLHSYQRVLNFGTRHVLYVYKCVGRAAGVVLAEALNPTPQSPSPPNPKPETH